MPPDLLELTAAGRHELNARERGLSLPQRWLLVRVNGKDSLAEIAQASNQADARQRLPLDAERLVQKGLAQWLVAPQDADAATVSAALEAQTPEVRVLAGWPPSEPPSPVDTGPAPRRRRATSLPAVIALAAAGLAAVVAVGLGLRGGSEGAPPVVAAAPAAMLPADPAARALPEPAAPAGNEAARPAAASRSLPAVPVVPGQGPSLTSASAAVPVPPTSVASPVAVAVPAPALAPITSSAPVPLPPVVPVVRSADPVAALPAPALAAPAAIPGRLQPVFSPRPRLPREWQDDSRAVVSFNANLRIDASGAVSEVSFSGVTTADTALVRASRQSLLQWRFPEGTPGRTHSVELVFRVE